MEYLCENSRDDRREEAKNDRTVHVENEKCINGTNIPYIPRYIYFFVARNSEVNAATYVWRARVCLSSVRAEHTNSLPRHV